MLRQDLKKANERIRELILANEKLSSENVQMKRLLSQQNSQQISQGPKPIQTPADQTQANEMFGSLLTKTANKFDPNPLLDIDPSYAKHKTKKTGTTLLHRAAEIAPPIEKIERLIQLSDVDVPSKTGSTPLGIAYHFNNFDIIQKLQEYGHRKIIYNPN